MGQERKFVGRQAKDRSAPFAGRSWAARPFSKADTISANALGSFGWFCDDPFLEGTREFGRLLDDLGGPKADCRRHKKYLVIARQIFFAKHADRQDASPFTA